MTPKPTAGCDVNSVKDMKPYNSLSKYNIFFALETASMLLTRREFTASLCGAAGLAVCHQPAVAAEDFKLRYILNSAMYGYTKVEEILPEVARAGAEAIDIWPKVHGNQREQIEEMGQERFVELLKEHLVRLGTVTCYKQGPFAMQDEMKFASAVGGRGVVLVTGAKGPQNVTGEALKEALQTFVKLLTPHAEAAAQLGCVNAIENHGNSLVNSPDSIRWFAEMARWEHVGVALATHHLPQDGALIGKLAEDLGPKVKFFYAQQHGLGFREKLPLEEELLQMPGRGKLDFQPIVKALQKMNYQGFTEIFMHPTPRGRPILEKTADITAEINRSRKYLNECL